LDAGQQITVNGPNGSKQLTPLAGHVGEYSAQLGGGQQGGLPLYLAQGAYSITGPGGKDVGAFTANLNIPEPLTWANAASITTVQRAQGQLITWSGGDPNGMVEISGYSLVLGTAQDGSDSVGAVFVCTAKVSDRQFDIPAAVLLALPPSSTEATGGVPIPTGFLTVGTSVVAPFTATGLDYGLANASVSTSQSVTYQ
jgi:hypothetical protein